MGVTVTVERPTKANLPILSMGFAEVQAGRRATTRRQVRRTVRRINRRHNYYNRLPTGCATVIFNGVRHYYCGGIYYLPQMDRNETVYVIVTP